MDPGPGWNKPWEMDIVIGMRRGPCSPGLHRAKGLETLTLGGTEIRERSGNTGQNIRGRNENEEYEQGGDPLCS